MRVISTINAPSVANTLAAIREYARDEDAAAKLRIGARTTQLGRRVTTAEKYELYGEAPPLAVKPEIGELLYLTALGRRARRVVEFGASHGISTIYLAAALRDAGGGRLQTTEILPGKCAATARNLAAAGLGDLVEILEGDALVTLRGVAGPVDLLFLDGRNDLYLPVLQLLEPVLADDAVILADLSLDDPDLVPYLAHVRGQDGPYVSLPVPLNTGLEFTIRQARRPLES
jgi:predicted O-methyltransferase YrrM